MLIGGAKGVEEETMNLVIEYKLNCVNEDGSLDSFVEILHLIPEVIQNE